VTLALIIAVAILLAGGRSSSAQTPTGDGDDTKAVTVGRGGRDFRTTVLGQEPAPDGRAMRASSLLVKFRPGQPPAQRDAAHRAAGGVLAERLRLPDTVRVNVARTAVPQALAAYRANPTVEYAEPDYLVRAIFTPNDPYFGQQWGMTKISAPAAWDRIRSSPGTRVAILDCGIFSSSSTFGPGHPDVRAKVVLEQNFTTSPYGADDYCNHGTHVAGIAAASTNNGIGVAGVGFDASIMNGKVLDDEGNGSLSQLINGIVWSADNGAKVINMSIGAERSCATSEQEAINYAWARGAVIVAAAGNGGSDRNGDPQATAPANCNRVLAVAATDVDDGKPNFSNYGAAVDLAAPGVNILSTNFVGSYESFSGTSQAAPHVAGLAALVWSTSWGTSNQAVVDRICSSADRIAGTGSLWACGRINAAAAVAESLPPTGPRTQVGVQVVRTGSGRLQVTITARTNVGSPTNTLRELRFGTAANARIDVPGGPIDSTGNVTVPLPAGTVQTEFTVRRAASGAFTVPLVAVDGYGDWRTFVGGGTAVP
jgi:thermitase